MDQNVLLIVVALAVAAAGIGFLLWQRREKDKPDSVKPVLVATGAAVRLPDVPAPAPSAPDTSPPPRIVQEATLEDGGVATAGATGSTGPAGADPVPVAAPRAVTLKAVYIDRDDLMKDLGAGYPYAVLVDGNTVHGGFGPADRYYTQPDGSLCNTPAIPTAKFATREAALAAYVGHAVTIDGVLVQGGFGQADGKPISLSSVPGGFDPA